MRPARERVETELGLSLDRSDLATLERSKSARGDEDVAELAEELLVHETWFFRDPAVFDELARVVVPLAAGAHGRPLRLLSAPCATGEEAYSIAIALLELGLPEASFEVVGVDVSRRALEAAEEGRYGKHSLRSERRGWEARFLIGDVDCWSVSAVVRERVRFLRANLVEPGALSFEAPFDVVFCRNMLVYLTEAAREAVERLLGRIVAPGGSLFLGPAESTPAGLFVRTGPRESFRFSRGAEVSTATRLVVPSALRVAQGAPSAAHAARTAPPATSVALARAAPPPSLASLSRARELADRGDLEGARSACVALLSEAGHDGEVYALLGTVESAAGRTDHAFRAFQRALYLDPDHPVALVSVARHWEQRGEDVRARALLARAARGRGRP